MYNLLKKIVLKMYRDYVKKYSNNELYTICSSQDFKDSFNFIKNPMDMYDYFSKYTKCDDMLPVLKETGESLENIFLNEEIVVGIYRTEFKDTILQSDKVKRIVFNGIPVTKYNFDIPNLANVVTFPNDFFEAMSMLKESTKNDKIDFILTFPKNIVNEKGECNLEHFYDIFFVESDGIYIKTDYIDSYIISNQGIMKRIEKQEVEKVLLKK